MCLSLFQIAELKHGAAEIVCTPGGMIDMLAANSGHVTNLRRMTYLLLDEADRMFDMGFEMQVMRIVDNSKPDKQTIMITVQVNGRCKEISTKKTSKRGSP